MAWQPITVLAGTPTKAVELNAVQANITAQASGDPGAPKQQTNGIADNAITSAKIANNAVGQSEIANNAVGQGELKTASGSVTYVVNINNPSESKSDILVLPGGLFGFYPRFSSSNTSSSTNFASISFSCSAGYNVADAEIAPVSSATLGGATGSTSSNLDSTLTLSQTYVTASPPYNIGGGDCSHFMFVKLAANGNIVSTYSAGAPPWAYNGPTDIRPDEVTKDKSGKLRKYKNIVVSRPVPPWKGGDPELYAAGPVCEKREIDHDLKNADMRLIPHPFVNLAPGERVVLIDPCSSLADACGPIEESGEALSSVLSSGYISLGDELDCNSPDGVIIVGADWKRSK